MFNILPVEISRPEVRQVNSATGYRFYENLDDPKKGPYPSVTSVLSIDQDKKDGLSRWRKRVGADEADRITRISANRGQEVHDFMENYVQNKPTNRLMPDAQEIVNQLVQIADLHIDNIRAVEEPLWSEHLRVAGTTDLVGDYQGRESIIDWKNSLKPKRREWISDYFMQKSAYAVAWEECTGRPVEQLVTIIGVQFSKAQVFISHRDDWIHKFREQRSLFDQVVLPKL